uniref:Tyrosine-protein phosphatase domain-containing protein n=1 Tax=Globodera pallida TaxID=36090 RepID=A0A183CER0_GLOPA
MNEVIIDVVNIDKNGTIIDSQNNVGGAADSFGSSLEIHDAVIDESWDWASVQRRLRQNNIIGNGENADAHEKKRHQKPTYVHLNIEDHYEEKSSQNNSSYQQETWVGIVWRWWNERAINARLVAYDEEERRKFIGLRIERVVAIFENEKAKEMLSGAMLCSKTHELLHRDDSLARLLQRKYGERMTELVVFYANQIEPFKNKKEKEKKKMAKKMAELERLLSGDFNDQLLATDNDPLTCWFWQRTDVSGRMLARIQNLASAISKRIAWSILIEPGRPRTDLSKFFAEFDVLESFFDKVELSPVESAQKAFDANSLLKVRNRKMTCADWSRIQLNVPAELVREGMTREEFVATKRHLQIFGDFDCPQISTRVEFGHGDFINASYVRGGPLLNTFILTQTPLQQTIPDFWRMIWQERSEFIVMLCEATTDSLAQNVVVGSAARTHCPFYWPRFEGESRRFGHLHVKNVGVDAATDPLFTIIHLELWVVEESMEHKDGPITSDATTAHRPHVSKSSFRLQLWQWDWRNYADFHWPFRVLIRARHSKNPSVLMCADGCGRSGTLALIEIFLMQLLRGAVSFEHPMLTAAVFLRLQRRHAVSNHIQYLFAYRAVLHWLQPFIISWYHRSVLGFTSRNSGFCGKYDEIARAYTHKKNLLI